MTNAEFLEHYEKAVTQERETLARNRDEYATGFTGMTPAHFNLVREIANGKHIAPEMLLKKIRDFRNYLILLEGILLSSCEERASPADYLRRQHDETPRTRTPKGSVYLVGVGSWSARD